MSTTVESHELEVYRYTLDKLAAEKSSTIFPNSTKEHAAIVLATMLNYCEKECLIYDRDLSGDISDSVGDVYLALQSFNIQGKSLTIVVDDEKKDPSKLLKRILGEKKKENPGNLNLYRASELFKSAITSALDKQYYFAVTDSRATRFEESKYSANGRSAICSFNYPELAEGFSRLFKDNLGSCTNISLN